MYIHEQIMWLQVNVETYREIMRKEGRLEQTFQVTLEPLNFRGSRPLPADREDVCRFTTWREIGVPALT